MTYKAPSNELVSARLPQGQNITTLLSEANVKLDSLVVQAAPEPAWSNLGGALLYALPTLLIVGGAILLLTFARWRMRASGNRLP